MGKAARDVNRVPTLIGVSSADGKTPVLLEVDSDTGQLLVKADLTSELQVIQTIVRDQINGFDDHTTTDITYVGLEDNNGAWLIKRIDETGNLLLITYATVVNNPLLTSYADAWVIRATTLVYGLYNEAI